MRNVRPEGRLSVLASVFGISISKCSLTSKQFHQPGVLFHPSSPSDKDNGKLKSDLFNLTWTL